MGIFDDVVVNAKSAAQTVGKMAGQFVDMSKLRRPALLTDADWSNLYAAADVISRAPIYIDDTPALTTLELRARARRLKAEKGLGLVIVDYLQLMRTSRRTHSPSLGSSSERSRAQNPWVR